jgi:hypothetical protein
MANVGLCYNKKLAPRDLLGRIYIHACMSLVARHKRLILALTRKSKIDPGFILPNQWTKVDFSVFSQLPVDYIFQTIVF